MSFRTFGQQAPGPGAPIADDVLDDLRGREREHAVAMGYLSFRPGAVARFTLADGASHRFALRQGGPGSASAQTASPLPSPPEPGPSRESATGALAPRDPAVTEDLRAAEDLRATEEPSATAFAHAVETALLRMAADPELTKVVLGRWATVSLDSPVSVPELADRLGENNPRATVFAMPAPQPGAPQTVLVGASPELLVARQGRSVTCRPLAGSIPRSTDPAEDSRRAADLAASAKNLAEHAIVVHAMRTALGPLCSRLDVPPAPELVATDAMWHLGTVLRGELTAAAAATFSALHLAQLLHPTPAVAGWPTARALDLIAELEPLDRGPMAGAFGWVDAAGDGEFHVTIRSALLSDPSAAGSQARLFAGAGIVAGSDPAAEVAETGAKLGTMLRVLA